MKQNIVFFGSGDFTVPVIEKLIPHGLDLVVTNEKNPNAKLIKLCSENKIKTLVASNASDLTTNQSLITNHSIAILASFGVFVPNEIINLFPNGIINIHPSLLPKWKGPSPVQYAILNNETVTGVTLIKLDNEIDHGPILSQRPYNLQGSETAEDLLSILFEIGAEMVEETIAKLENGETLKETPQDPSHETWSYRIEKKDGMIDTSSILDVSQLQRKVRAYYPWPSVWFVCHPEQNEGSVFSRHPELVSGSSKLQTKIVKLLPENKIQVQGKSPMSYKDFINGFGDAGREILEKLRLI